MTHAQELLQALVTKLNDTHWSSWQSTAKFDEELQRAEEYLNELSKENVG